MVLLTLLAALISCAPRPPVPPDPLTPTDAPQTVSRRWKGPTVVAKARVIAVGDLLMHGMVQKSAALGNRLGAAGESLNHEGFPVLFEHVDDYLRSADLTFANLETPVAPKANKGTRQFVFNVSAAFLPALQDVGFDVVSFANNHVYDQGRDGFVETLDNLEGSKLTFVGAGRTCDQSQAPKMTETNGIKVAWLGASKVYTDNLNAAETEACSFAYDRDKALAAVKAARAAGAEIVIFSIHWGQEYKTAPSQAEVDDAHALMDGGVDLIIGHHPHVLQPVEIYATPDGRRAVVAYSLGNFISNQSAWYLFGTQQDHHGYTRDGLALQVDLVKKDYGPGPDGSPQVKVELANVLGVPLWTDNNSKGNAETPLIRTVLIDEELKATQAALEAEKDWEKSLALKRRIELLNARREAIIGVIGAELLPPLPE